MEWRKAAKIDGGVNIPNRWVYMHYYEAFNLLFRIENALRVFVYVILKNELKDKWAEAQVTAEDDEGTILSLAKKRMSQAQTFGYLGHPIACPIMHLNSGELARLIVSDAYWELFKPYFHGGKGIIKNKLDEIGSIRNSLAHFRPIRADDVDVIKQNSKHVFLGIEQFLNQVLMQTDVVPTNTQHAWYKSLKTLGTDLCTFTFYQSTDEHWTRVMMAYACPIIKKDAPWQEHMNYTVLNVKSSSVLTKYQKIAEDICYLSEVPTYPKMLKDGKAEFRKIISFVLSRSMLEEQHETLRKEFENLLLTIASETELIQRDNLARGQLIHTALVSASLVGEANKKQWRWNYSKLQTPVLENDPPEYWGSFNIFSWEDFVAATEKYPWMPETVSTEELPF
jgi:hypothetical protein